MLWNQVKLQSADGMAVYHIVCTNTTLPNILFISHSIRFKRRDEIIPVDAAEGDVMFDRNSEQRYGNCQKYS